MRKAIAVCGVILLGLGTFLLLLELSIFPLGTRNQIAIAEHPNTYGTLGFFLESGQNCIVEIDAAAHYGSAYIKIRQVQNGFTILGRAGASCNGNFTMEFQAPATGNYLVEWDFLDYVPRIGVYRIDEMVPAYAVLVADVLVLVVGVIILSIGVSKS